MGEVYNWLWVTTKRRVLEKLELAHLHREQLVASWRETEALATAPALEDEVLQREKNRELSALVSTAVAELDAPRRTVVALHSHGYNGPAIAQEMRTSRTAGQAAAQAGVRSRARGADRARRRWLPAGRGPGGPAVVRAGRPARPICRPDAHGVVRPVRDAVPKPRGRAPEDRRSDPGAGGDRARPGTARAGDPQGRGRASARSNSRWPIPPAWPSSTPPRATPGRWSTRRWPELDRERRPPPSRAVWPWPAVPPPTAWRTTSTPSAA